MHPSPNPSPKRSGRRTDPRDLEVDALPDVEVEDVAKAGVRHKHNGVVVNAPVLANGKACGGRGRERGGRGGGRDRARCEACVWVDATQVQATAAAGCPQRLAQQEECFPGARQGYCVHQVPRWLHPSGSLQTGPPTGLMGPPVLHPAHPAPTPIPARPGQPDVSLTTLIFLDREPNAHRQPQPRPHGPPPPHGRSRLSPSVQRHCATGR